VLRGPGNAEALDRLRAQGWHIDKHAFLPSSIKESVR
jgi:hypothetical protein